MADSRFGGAADITLDSMAAPADSLDQVTPLERAELFLQLQNAIALRSAQDQVLWTILGFFGATNAVLLSVIFSNGDFPKTYWVAAIAVAGGMLLSLAWSSIQSRALGHIRRHEALMESLERELSIPPGLAVSGSINRVLYEQAELGARTPARVLISQVGWFALFLWIVVGCICSVHYAGLKSVV